MLESKKNHSTPLYAIRRTLPAWCFDERLEELVDFCREARVDEVVIKVDSEEFSHGLPTIEWVKNYMPMLARAKSALQSAGVVFSINPWVTQGHIDRGRDLRDTFPDFDWMVGHDGTQCLAQACPRGESFNRYIAELWALYATLEPRVIWVEDDIRTFNHLPARYSCFCDLHLAAFAQRVGEQKVEREALVSRLLAPGQPDAWRSVWFDLLRDTMRDLCSVLAKSVHAVSPKTRLGLMSSGPNNHCLDGRDWCELAGVMRNEHSPIHSRATLGNYVEESARGLYESAAQIQRTRYVLPRGTIEQTEVENVPFTEYAKSRSFTAAQIALSVAHGCAGATLNLFDHVGSPMSLTPGFGEMLRDHRSVFDELRSALGVDVAFDGKLQGVRVLHRERAADVRQLEAESDYSDLVPPDYAFESALNMLGFPTTYEDSPVVAIEGQMIDAYRDDEIDTLLRGGVLVDAVALGVLERRGFGEQLGASLKEIRQFHVGCVTSAEAMVDPAFGGAADRYVTLTLPDLLGAGRYGCIEPAADANVASWMVDQERQRVTPMLTLFENALGGRIAVLPYEICTCAGPAFLHPYRRGQFEAVLRWLSRDTLPAILQGGAYPLGICAEVKGQTVLTAFNLGRDPWAEVQWDIAYEGSPKVELIGSASKAQPKVSQVDGRLKITINEPLAFGKPLACVLRR